LASNENKPRMRTENPVVGKVLVLCGTVKAISPSGAVRILAPNDLVYANDRIATESEGSVSVMIDGAPLTKLNLGGMSNALIDEDVYAGVAPEATSEAAAEVEQVQEALLKIDKALKGIHRDRRHPERKEVILPAFIGEVHSQAEKFGTGTILDISIGGIRLSVPKGTNLEKIGIETDEFSVTFSLTSKPQPIKVKCQPKWVSDSTEAVQIGAAFVDPNFQIHETLQKYLM